VIVVPVQRLLSNAHRVGLANHTDRKSSIILFTKECVARSLSDIAIRGQVKEVGQLQGRKPGRPDVYQLEYIEDFFNPSTTQMVVDRSPQ